ncbi:MAG TPA: DUF1109 domain-containing protein [Rhizomicrobium sp.]|jgi:hypothetical protein|nr:DUF1109 domain-containing protein [Rhizomicrobium sp.]
MSDLTNRLSSDLTPVSPWQLPRRLLLGLGVGLAVSIGLVLAVLGPRPDMAHAVHTPMFWVKLLYPLSLVLIAGLAAERLARPAGSARTRLPWLVLPLALVFALALIEFIPASPAARHAMLMGGSSRVCPFLVLAAAVPPLAGLIWAMRGLAPTRLGAAGTVIGIVAGGAGAFAYSWHCTETGAPFLAVWYTLGMAAAALLGFLLGPRILRW